MVFDISESRLFFSKNDVGLDGEDKCGIQTNPYCFLILTQWKMSVEEFLKNIVKSKFLLQLKPKNRQSTKTNKKLFHFTSFFFPCFALLLFEFVELSFLSLSLSCVWSHESAGYLVERGDCIMCWYACVFHMFSTKFKCTYMYMYDISRQWESVDSVRSSHWTHFWFQQCCLPFAAICCCGGVDDAPQ